MKQPTVVFVVVVTFLVLRASPVAAQGVELGGGLGWAFGDLGRADGFFVDVAATVHPGQRTSVAVIADVSFLVQEDGGLYLPVGAGVRFKFLRNSRVSPIVQVTGGILFLPGGSSTPMFGGGGGVQVKLSQLIDAKYQFDLVFFSGASAFRHVVGVVFKFGGR